MIPINISTMPIHQWRSGRLGDDSEFMDAIANTDIDTLLATVDELMDCLALINPKLYNTVLAKLRG